MKQKQKPTCAKNTAVAYARYSSSGQRDVSIDQQLRDIYAFADREGYTVVHEYTDHAKSGYKNASARVEFQAMLSDAQSGRFDTVLCWKVDRFGRNLAQSTIYKDQLSALGVSVIYVMEPIPDGAAGFLTEGMLKTLAEWYSRNLSENVTRGMMDNARKCLYNGTKVLGYTRGTDNHYVIVPEEASTVRHIFSQYLNGYSAAAICRQLTSAGILTTRGCPFSAESLLRIISNERYTGTYIWGDIRIPDGMPAIISRKDWEEAQRMKKKTARHVEQRTMDFLLTGKAFCGHCGRAMIGDSGTSKSGTTHYYYTCQGRKARSGCPKKNHRKEELEDFVINYILDVVLTEEQMEKMAALVAKDMQERQKRSPLAGMKKELAEIKVRIANTNRAISAGVFGNSTLEMLHELEETAEDLKKNIAITEYAESQLLDPDRVLFTLHKFAAFDRKNPRDRRQLITVFLNSIYVYDDHLKILINAEEGAAIIPLDSLPDDDPACSDNVTCRVLVRTHPNTTAFLFVAWI